MSEVQSRPAASRGRGPARAGRGGGFTSRGGSRVANKAPNGDSHQNEFESAAEDEGEIGQLKQKFGSKVPMIKEMFETWSDIDILYALQEADGDANLAVERIADGTATQWGEVSKQKKAPKAKAKTDAAPATNADSAPRTGRGGRFEGGRGRGGRATERGGRGGGRGKPVHAPINGTRSNETQPLSVPTEESSAWDTPKPTDDATTSGWGDSTNKSSAPAAESTPVAAPTTSTPSAAPKSTSVATPSTPMSWANIARKSTAPKPAPKPKDAPAPQAAESTIEPLPPAEPSAEPQIPDEAPAATEEKPSESQEPASTADHPSVAVPEVALPPSHDQLNETNLDRVEDDSHPPPTETAASEAADSWAPRGADLSATATPLSSAPQKQDKPISSGYAATALKATERAPVRTPSYQRRVLEQEEAVRMPGNRDQIDRAAVQFGAFSLNEDEDDIDGDREEPETRAQPPIESPVTQPRASLPPVQPPSSLQDAYSAQKPASSLPPSGPAASAIAPPSQPSAASQAAPVGQNTQQYGRFGQSVPQEPAGFGSQKPYDVFGQQQQPTAPQSQDQYPGSFGSQTQAPPAQSQGQQQPGGGFSSAPSDYSSYYTAGAQDRSQYSNYYNQFGGPQQSSQGPPEGPSSQQQQAQRSYMGGNYNAPPADNLSQYPQSSAQRYGSASALDNSGNTTPNPSAAQGPPSTQSGQTQPQGQQPHDYANQYAQHPYYNSPYYSAYMNQYQGYGQGGYGNLYGKGSPYGQPGYGMNAQGPYGNQGASPAGGFAQSSLHRADSGGAAGLGEYGRAPSAQAGSQPALGSSGYGGMHDSFNRGGPYGAQGQSYNASQPGNPPVDDLKQFGDAKTGAGPSPSMGLAARPGSATNNAPSGLPPAQSGQQGGFGAASGYGSYPGQHAQGLHGAQGGASGYGMSASGNQGHGNNPYGGYGHGFGGNSYYGNQQQQQQQRGWGGNYH